MPLLSTFGAASARGFGNLSGIIVPVDNLWNTVSFLSHFDGTNNGVNNAFDDGSASNHTITANGNVTQGSFGPFARPDGEWAFNNTASTNDSFKVTAHDNFDMTNPFTIEGWIFIPDLAVNKLLFGRENNYWMTHDYQGIGGASGKFGFNYQNSGNWGAINASAATVANTWYFLQATYVGTTVTFYVNGASQGTASVGSPSSNTDKPFYVLSGPGAKATGTASNVRLSSVARSTSLPTDKFTSDSDTELLVCQSNRFVDNGPDGHTITTTAGASVSAFGPFLTSEVYDPAVNGASAYFDGNGDYLALDASNDFDLSDGDITWEFFVYPTAATSSGGNQLTIFEYFLNDEFFRFITYDTNISLFQRVSAGDYALNSSGKIPLNSWTHVAITRASNNEYKIFCNGVLVANSTNSIAAMNTASIPLLIGLGQLGDGGRYFPGYISNFRLTKGSLVYTSAFTPPTAPLTAITNTKLLLNMADGQAIDSAAQNNLTLYGNAKISSTQSKFGGTSMVFDGTGDYASFADADAGSMFNFGATKWTIEGWFYQENDAGSGANSHAIISRWDSANSDKGFIFRITDSSGQKLQWLHTADGSTNVVYTDSRTISNDTWYHFALVKNDNLTLYLNGTGAVLNSSTFTIASTTIPTLIGALHDVGSPSQYFDGFIDEVRVSHTARYTSNFVAPSAPFPDKGQ